MAPRPSASARSAGANAAAADEDDDAVADAAWADEVLSRWFAEATSGRRGRAKRPRATTSDASARDATAPPAMMTTSERDVREEYRALRARFNARARVEDVTMADACALMYGVERARAAFEGAVIDDDGHGARANGSGDTSTSHSDCPAPAPAPRRRGGAWRVKWLTSTAKDARDALVEFQSTSLAVDEDMYAKACGSRRARAPAGEPSAVASRDGKGCCPFCKVWFSRQHLPAHVRAKHTGTKPFVCERERCGEVFVDKKALNRHIALVHDHTFKCTVAQCSQVFSTKQMLQRHTERVHGGARAVVFACPHPTCGKTYKYENSLVQHVRTHAADGGLRFACPYPECARKFKHKADMLRHHRTHFGQRAKAPRVADVNAFLTDTLRRGPDAFTDAVTATATDDRDDGDENATTAAAARMSRWLF